MDERFFELQDWLKKTGYDNYQIKPLAGDASFRRYFRLSLPEKTVVVMDAPPEKENIESFVAIAHTFLQQGIQVPQLHAWDSDRGFILLGDLGDDLYLRILNPENSDFLYKLAIDSLIEIQKCQKIDHYTLPAFDYQFMMKELKLFEEWFLEKHLQLELTSTHRQLLKDFFSMLLLRIEQQPQLCVHRDYHSRNLVYLPTGVTGILDFQDAVTGPMTYDLVSLLKDCYISWPVEKVREWVGYYFLQATEHQLLANSSFDIIYEWFEWMGVQRHLKAAFIFARQNLLYGNPRYLADIPRTLQYVEKTVANFPEMRTFAYFLGEEVMPLITQAHAGENY